MINAYDVKTMIISYNIDITSYEIGVLQDPVKVLTNDLVGCVRLLADIMKTEMFAQFGEKLISTFSELSSILEILATDSLIENMDNKKDPD